MATDLFGRPLARDQLKTAASTNSSGRTRPLSEITTRVEHGDCLEVLKRLAGEGISFDSCVTDPPYHLTATVKRFEQTSVEGVTKAERSAAGRSDSYGRLSKGVYGAEVGWR